MIIIQEYDLSSLKPLFETNDYAIYKLGYITDEITKGVRLNKKTNKQEEIQIKLIPTPHIIKILTNQKSL